MDLINKAREEMGYPPFENNADNARQRTGQAAITAVLAGFYQLSRSEKGINYLLNKDKNVPWSVELFGGDAVEVVEKISRYGGSPAGEVSGIIDEAGNAIWKNISEELKGRLDFVSFVTLFEGMGNSLLQYLPPALQLEKMLQTTGINDRSQKIEGPATELMHKIEERF